MGRIRVLIANHHTLFRQGLKKILEEQPDIQLVGEASSGYETVAKAGALSPNVILMDVNIPPQGGASTTRAIKERHSGMEIIGVASHSDRESLLEMVKAGAIGYILQDVESEELIKAIHFGYSGQSMLPPEVATKLVEELANLMHRINGLQTLTPREEEILQLVAQGFTNRDIANRLFISDKTVRNHVSNILRKLELKDRTQAALYALRMGLVKNR
ncbi:MAG: response regulator transcription factor [Firmicutes bacterium]|nr:response regulator transcription factor [Bacillota bacterium]